MGQIHHLALPKTNQGWFIASDWHSFNLNIPAFEILLKHANLLPKKDRNLIIAGDFIDAPYFMGKSPDFQTWKDRKDGVDAFFLPEFEKEVQWANDTLDALQSVFNHIIFMNGNHDQPRLDFFKEKYCPVEYKAHFNLGEKLKLLKRNIGEIEYNSWLDFGDLSVTHGAYHGPSCHKSHYLAVGARNVIFGHIHSSECKAFVVRGETKYAWSLAAMCNLNPHYIKNREQNWGNGYATLTMRPNGKFNLHNHVIIDNQLILPDGTILEGTK